MTIKPRLENAKCKFCHISIPKEATIKRILPILLMPRGTHGLYSGLSLSFLCLLQSSSFPLMISTPVSLRSFSTVRRHVVLGLPPLGSSLLQCYNHFCNLDPCRSNLTSSTILQSSLRSFMLALSNSSLVLT